MTMINEVIPFPQSQTLNWTVTGAATVSGRPVYVGGRGFGVPVESRAIGEMVALKFAGRFTFTKATGASTALTVGEQVGWDFANNRVRKSASGLGVVTRAAADGDTTVEVELVNTGELSVRQVGNSSGGGVTIDFGTAANPNGVYDVMVVGSDNSVRTLASTTWLTGPAGRVTVVTSNGAANDVVMVRARF